MIHKYASRLLLALLLLADVTAFAQKDITDIQREVRLKKAGNVTGVAGSRKTLSTPVAISASARARATSSACNCWIPRDNTFQVAPMDGFGTTSSPAGSPPDYRNDDWSTAQITLPFNMCFYGRQVNKIFINNNGNISIDSPYWIYSPIGFPDSTYTMIAPFWADVDTRGGLSGLVWYSVTPTHLIVQWENVGYFGIHDDKLNTFQLIITDGNDPIIPFGQNVQFCYKDMQWTTGDASNGTNGFGGFPATVGINKGANGSYIQFGRFDSPGTNYDGPFGAVDQVDWLDNQSFTINACTNTSNIPPVLNSLNVCDTIRVCENNTYQLTAKYLSPEQLETTSISLNTLGMTGVNVLSNTPGNTAAINFEIVGSGSNIGLHTLQMTAQDDGSPVGITINNVVVEVLPAPLPSFTFFPNTTVTTNTPIQFTNTTPPGSLLSWDYGDGGRDSNVTAPQHSFTNAGVFNVTLTATFPNGCSSSTVRQVSVCSASADFTVTPSCTGSASTVTFTGVSFPANLFTWNFNGGNIISGSGSGPYEVQWNSAGTYQVSLTVSGTICSASSTIPVNVNQTPISSITPVLPLCVGDAPNISFNGTSGSGASYSWNFGSGNVVSGSGSGPYSLRWYSAGNDSVSLIVTENGCSDTSQISVQIKSIPLATFNVATNICADNPLSVTYTGTSNPTANYNWDFSGANIISGLGQGPYSISWNTNGSFNVSLTVIENGCSSVPVTSPVLVTSAPAVVIVAPVSVCPSQPANITYNGSGSPTSLFNWNFGSANVFSGSGPGPYTVDWNSPGNYQVQLSVDDNGCVGQSFVDIVVNPIPTADFTVSSILCEDAPVTITYSGSAGYAANYNWNFNGGNIVSGSGAGPYLVEWNSQGNYNVSLNVEENTCISPVFNQPVAVNALPTAYAGVADSVCSGVAVQLGRAALAGENYSWAPTAFLSNPAISNPVVTPVNNSSSINNINYVVFVTDANGCMITDTVSIQSYPLPVVSFIRPLDECLEGNNFSFKANSNITAGLNYQWTFSLEANIASSQAQNVSVIYNAPGKFPVILAGDFMGCPATQYIDSVTVHEMPNAVFEPLQTQGCEPLTVDFTNTSDGNSNVYSWSFGDESSTNTITNPTHVYDHSGIYSVKLIATTPFGCMDDTLLKDIINVYSLPVGKFIPTPEITNILSPIIQFDNYSSNVSVYAWDFGDSDTSMQLSPSHTYTDTGSFLVTLLVMAPHGCADTVRGIVRVEENFSFYVPNSFTPNGDGVNDYFRGYGLPVTSYLMNIYDRWGRIIFTSNDYNKAWDGNVKSEGVQNDVYVYRIVVADHEHKSHTYVGNVSVVR